MPRIPYELVAMEADRMLMSMVDAKSRQRMDHYWEMYLGYLEACGWTDESFDKETLKRIDAAWIIVKLQKQN